RHTRSYGDWSSDVCSSDLFDRRRLRRDLDGAGQGRARGAHVVEVEHAGGVGQSGEAIFQLELEGAQALKVETAGREQLAAVEPEIGRASCRERGEIGGGGG